MAPLREARGGRLAADRTWASPAQEARNIPLAFQQYRRSALHTHDSNPPLPLRHSTGESLAILGHMVVQMLPLPVFVFLFSTPVAHNDVCMLGLSKP